MKINRIIILEYFAIHNFIVLFPSQVVEIKGDKKRNWILLFLILSIVGKTRERKLAFANLTFCYSNILLVPTCQGKNDKSLIFMKIKQI